MQGDARVIEYLNRGLRHELTAINQYWLHYRLLDNWGFRALAKIWRKESIEEMEHAEQSRGRRDLAARWPWRERNHPVWLGRRDGKGLIRPAKSGG